MMVFENYLLILFAFFLSVLITKFVIKREASLGLVAEDLHKEKKVMVPKVGGVAIAVAFSIVMISAYVLKGSLIYPVVLLAFLVSTAVGLIDDYFEFPPWRKLILPSFGAIPLLILIPWDPLRIVALFAFVSVASNWTNMLAGFNGLEVGLGAIMLFFLALNTGPVNAFIILMVYAGVLLGFLVFNKYPAKVFPGDTGTIPIGAVLVSATLLGAPAYKLLILFIPHMVDAVLKFTSAGIMDSRNFRPSRIKNGYLVPGRSYLSLSKLLMKIRPLKEWQLISIYWTAEICLGIITLLI